MGHQGVIVPIRKTIAVVFTPNHRAVAPDAFADFGEAQAGVKAAHDLHALFETDPMPWASRPAQVSRAGQPTKTVLPFA